MIRRLKHVPALGDVDETDILSAPQPAAIHEQFEPPRDDALSVSSAPGRWLVVDEKRDAPRRDGVDLSHALARIRVRRPEAPILLSSGISIDTDPAVLTPGESAITAYRDVTVILASRDDAIDVYVSRSRAQSLWTWLTDAERSLD